jgi:hypothetical protein
MGSRMKPSANVDARNISPSRYGNHQIPLELVDPGASKPATSADVLRIDQ